MEIMRMAIAAFAIYRLAILLAEDDGPMFVFKRLRDFTAYKSGAQLLKDSEYGFWVSLNEGLSCAFCVGLWLSLFCVPLLIWPTVVGDTFLIVFALAGGQTLLQKVTN